MHSTSKSNFKYHYFYKITNIYTGEFYYGVHSTNNLYDNYMGSGTRLKKLYKLFGKESFNKEILKYFDNRGDLLDYEHQIVNEKILKNPLCLNMITGGMGSYDGYTTKGLVTVKDNEGNIFEVSCSDPRYLSGELKSIVSNMVVVRDKNGQCMQVSVTDPRYLSGELVIVSKGNKGFKGWTIVYKNGEYKNIKKIDLDDYLDNGWQIRSKVKGRTSPTKNKIWLFKNNKQIVTTKEESLKYLQNGWSKGRLVKPNDGKIGIFKNGANKYINPDELNQYMEDGWQKKMSTRNKGKLTITLDEGKTWISIDKNDPKLKTLNYKTISQIKPTCKGKKYIHKNGLVKRVNPDDYDKFINDGWLPGLK